MKVELGAGSTINLLLDKAVIASKKAFGKLTLEDAKLEDDMMELEIIEAEKLKREKE